MLTERGRDVRARCALRICRACSVTDESRSAAGSPASPQWAQLTARMGKAQAEAVSRAASGADAVAAEFSAFLQSNPALKELLHHSSATGTAAAPDADAPGADMAATGATAPAMTVPPPLQSMVDQINKVLADFNVELKMETYRPHITVVRNARTFESIVLAPPLELQWSEF